MCETLFFGGWIWFILGQKMDQNLAKLLERQTLGVILDEFALDKIECWFLEHYLVVYVESNEN